jgi:hypothetical protein
MDAPQLHSSISDWVFVPVIFIGAVVAFFALRYIDGRENEKRDR